MKARSFYSETEQERIKTAIQNAELNTSGEIRVHLEETCKNNPVKRAIQVFEKLQMHKTALRNGVLIYLSVADRKLAIIGDQGINKAVPSDFWDEISAQMKLDFAMGKTCEGLEKAIQASGEKLKQFFPYQSDDINELPDEISFND